MIYPKNIKSNIGVFLCLFLLSSVSDVADSKVIPKKKPTEVVKEQKAPPNVNHALIGEAKGFAGAALASRLDTVLSTLKITNCSMRIKQAVMALSDGQPTDFFIEPMSPFPNFATNVITIESANQDNEPRYSILYVNPSCDGLYTQTISWSLPCDDVKKRFFPNFQSDKVISNSVQSYRSGNNLQLSLIPTDKKCISVKKEMFR